MHGEDERRRERGEDQVRALVVLPVAVRPAPAEREEGDEQHDRQRFDEGMDELADRMLDNLIAAKLKEEKAGLMARMAVKSAAASWFFEAAGPPNSQNQ